HGVVKHDDVAPPDRAVGNQQASASPVTELIDQQVVADQQRVLHRHGGNMKCLDDVGNDEHGNHHRRQQRLQGGEPVRLIARRIGGRCHCVGAVDCLGTTLPSAAPGNAARYPSTCRAASCSAFFLVVPSARPTNSTLPNPGDESLTSTVN